MASQVQTRAPSLSVLVLISISFLPSLASAFFQPSDYEATKLREAQAQREAELQVEIETGYSRATLALIHGLVAWFALGALIPLGMFAGNWSQSGTKKGWMHAHWSINVLAVLIILASAVLAGVYLWNPPNTSAHGVLGFLTVAAIIAQVLQGIILHIPIPAISRAIVVGVHRVWALITFIAGSAAVISGLVLLAQYSGDGFVAVTVVSSVQGIWTLAVTGAMLYLYLTPTTDTQRTPEDGGEGGPKGLEVLPLSPHWAPVDLDAPLTVSWQKTPKGEGEKKTWEPVNMA